MKLKNIIWIIIIAVIGMLVISCSTAIDEYRLEDNYYIKETEKFKFVCYEKDHAYMYDIEQSLKNNYEKVLHDLGLTRKVSKITVKVYPTLKEFHKNIGLTRAPKYIVGKKISEKEFKMVSPNAKGLVHTYEQIVNGVAVHEFTHCITDLVIKNRKVPKWLQESIALYEANQKIIPNELPDSFKEISEMKYNIYSIGYLLMEYLVKQYDVEIINKLLLAEGDIESVIGKKEDEFFNEWLEYVKKFH
ncbi:hypothetical protein [Paramaledivibacter caminithermalis]|uniref:Peptidase MA superfamily protein n=1 Tax=Paramaledivibacter caminithermalis (strain DSM 15212 / CIP 107654 / DViRD3) TaxID=1121301 RepID=A0A1M6QQL8_PARC5|nr:hypothetical protein [Paramaledivibacter caminithermalis]SHK22524.1 hypothetical protein SAMN02745912_02684 [Paramaledivibacter caminithermalis DSM 15212]